MSTWHPTLATRRAGCTSSCGTTSSRASQVWRASPAAGGARRGLLLTASARAELLDPDHRPDDLLEVRRREGLAQEVAAEVVADRGHDDALVERQVRVRHGALLSGVVLHSGLPSDVDAVAETPLPVHPREVACE